jgi:hypothetical protein
MRTAIGRDVDGPSIWSEDDSQPARGGNPQEKFLHQRIYDVVMNSLMYEGMTRPGLARVTKADSE